MSEHPLIVLTPVFDDRAVLRRLLAELCPLREQGWAVRVIVVDDGSMASPVTAEVLAEQDLPIEALILKRNVGHQKAIAVGLAYVAEHHPETPVLVMDADGEDPPEAIGPLLAMLRRSEPHAVVAQRRRRSDSVLFKLHYTLYKWLFRLLTGHFIDFGNFSALSAPAVARLADMQELLQHYPATLIKSRLPLDRLPVDRGMRYDGSSKMNVVSLVSHGLRAVAVFTEDALTRIILICTVVAITCVTLISVALAHKILGYATPGWFTAAVGALTVMLFQIGTIGLLSMLLVMRSNASLGRFDRGALLSAIKTRLHANLD